MGINIIKIFTFYLFTMKLPNRSNSIKTLLAAWMLWLSAPVVAQTDDVSNSSNFLLEVQAADTINEIKSTETQMLINNIMNDPDNFCNITIRKQGESTTINAWLSANSWYGQELHMFVNKTMKWRGYINNYSYGLADTNGDNIPDFIKMQLVETRFAKTNPLHQTQSFWGIKGTYPWWYSLLADNISYYQKFSALQQEVLDAFAFDPNCWEQPPAWLVELPQVAKSESPTLRWKFNWRDAEEAQKLLHILD